MCTIVISQLVKYHDVSYCPNLLNIHLDHVSILQELGRIHPQAYTRWGSHHDACALTKGRTSAQVRNDLFDAVNHVGSRSLLPDLPIDLGNVGQHLGVRDQRSGCDTGPDGRELIE